MAQLALIIGESGSGKSASLRNFNREDAMIFSLEKSHLPFRKKMNVIKNMFSMSYTERYKVILEYCKKYQDKCKVFVIDDADYLMFFEQQQRSNEGGYSKYTEMAKKFIDLKHQLENLNDDVTVYFLMHSFTDANGYTKARTAGKMIDEQLSGIDALFEIELIAKVIDKDHKFITNSDGTNSAKSPIGMFENTYIDNDLKEVDRTIREYYEMPQISEEEKGEENGDQDH